MPKIDYPQRKPRGRRTPPHAPLGALRAAAGLTLDEVCNRVGEELETTFTRGALSAIENGLRGASTEVLHALEIAYGIPAGSLDTDYQPRARHLEGVSA